MSKTKKFIITGPTRAPHATCNYGRPEHVAANEHYVVTIESDDPAVTCSDGDHTFDELYDHRIELFIALCKLYIERDKWRAGSCGKSEDAYVWRSPKHSDGSSYDGWFILGISVELGKQITYHVQNDRWSDCEFAAPRERAPVWDGHTSRDVIERLKKL